jgi:GNAT superfamily N-acetyltransferase
VTEIKPLTAEDIERVFPLWAKTYPAKYQITPKLLKQKTVDHPSFLPNASFYIESNGNPSAFIASKSDPYGTLFGEPNLNRIHINSLAYSNENDFNILLSDIYNDLSRNHPITFGQDQGHFFPGVPEECPNIISLLESDGFEKQGNLANDLEHDLTQFNPDPTWLEPLNQPNLRVQTCTMADIPALDEFFQREFPGRWHYDTVTEKCQTWHEPPDIIALWQNDTIEGFAYTQNYHHQAHPIAGYNWHIDLGPQSGALGPIGVSKRVRGQKLGGALLVAGLNHLKALGVHKCIIDWTSLVDFYGKYGFQVNRRYQPMTKPQN